MTESKVVLAYWGIRGLGQPIRNLLEYLNIPYQDKVYKDSEEWIKDKATLKSDFPNLPYLIDGDKIITESEAIHVYLALKAERNDLLGDNTPEERVHIAQVKGVLQDLKKAFYGVVPNKPLTDFQKGFNEKLLPRLTVVAKHLGKNDFLVGKLSILDFSFSEFLSPLLNQEGDWLGSLPNLKKYYERFANLPGIKEYNASGRASQLYVAPHTEYKVQK